jgi:hypothetical protein
MPEQIKLLPLMTLLLIAATLIFLVILVPLTILSFGPNISILTLGLMVIITTVASLVSLLFYIMLSKKGFSR